MIYAIAVVGAFLGGVINTLAGNGSAITLTVLTELLGLPGNIANATNRVGVFTQSVASSWAFYHKDRLKLDNSGLYIVLTTIGALAGIYLALVIDNASFKQVFKYLLALMLVVVLVNPKRWLAEYEEVRVLP
ncbi:MAG: sulfite exporter TauE/SafE family protein, partial [Bacteroidota bacterium]